MTRITVCELHAEPAALERDWQALAEHIQAEDSQLVLLPEMPFSPWFAHSRTYKQEIWQAAVEAHERWLMRLAELAPAMVLGTRPLEHSGIRLNAGFAWDVMEGYREAHAKYYLPNEEGFWEASWYQRGEGEFSPIQCGEARVGFAICTELWFMQRAREYGKQGVQLLVTPRATLVETREKWLVGGRAGAIVAGAFSLSSNHTSPPGMQPQLGGQGWVIAPDGEVLGLTSSQRPFLTVEVDLAEADRAKGTYPRYVED